MVLCNVPEKMERELGHEEVNMCASCTQKIQLTVSVNNVNTLNRIASIKREDIISAKKRTKKVSTCTNGMCKIMFSSTSTHDCHRPQRFLIKHLKPRDNFVGLV